MAGECAASDGHSSAHSQKFKKRHLSMMALGSAIGAGFFLGTGVAVSKAGPAVLISYALAALIAVSVIFALAELASALPSTGSFSTYAEAGIGRWAGFTAGWLYWSMLIMVLGMEITGAAAICVRWFPALPQWVVALAIVVVLGGINLLAARSFGEVEAWLAGIKVVAIIAFLLVGLALIFGVIPGRVEPVVDTIVGHGGLMPNGMSGVAIGLLAIITSFGGIEIVTIAAAEAEDARAAMGAAIRSVIMRILVFYVGSVVVLICLLPWNLPEMAENPFASVLKMAGVPAVATIMEAVVFIALISAFSANIYASSRMAYSLSARGMGVRWLLGKDAVIPPYVRQSESVVEGESEKESQGLGPLSVEASSGKEPADCSPQLDPLSVEASHEAVGDIERGRTPRRAVSVSIALSLVSVGLNWWLPDTLLGVLLNAIGMVLLIIWVFVLIAQMRLHHSLEQSGKLAIRMPGWPWLPWVVLVALVGVAGLMAWDPAARQQLIAMSVLTLIVIGLFFLKDWWMKRRLA
ncbi:amino acid permease [Schaalia sp. ZJ1691]|uniref:amino acid permease n=1 Tax=Schaalia sp. ZJ1691 TaxID=2709404 RepID=UPI001F153D00|nr:amino acid permease [Schaalia sp. ZJ1691]